MFNDLNQSNQNSGYRKDLSKEEIIKISRDEREKRHRQKMQEKTAPTVQKLLRGYIGCKRVQESLIKQNQIIKIVNDVTTVLGNEKLNQVQKQQILAASLSKVLHLINCLLRLQLRLKPKDKETATFQVQLINLLSVESRFRVSSQQLGLQVLSNLMVKASLQNKSLLKQLELIDLLHVTNDDCQKINITSQDLDQPSRAIAYVLLRKLELPENAVPYVLTCISQTNQEITTNFVYCPFQKWLLKIQGFHEFSEQYLIQIDTAVAIIQQQLDVPQAEAQLTQEFHMSFSKLHALTQCTQLLIGLSKSTLSQTENFKKVMNVVERRILALSIQNLSEMQGTLSDRCSLIGGIMDLIQISRGQKLSQSFNQLENEIVYKSDFMLMLYDYLTAQNPQTVKLFETDIVALFCSIVNQRITLIDDKEFLGQVKSSGSQFFSKKQLETTCDMLNQFAYIVFKNETTVGSYNQFLIENLKAVVQKLVNRDMRLKLFHQSFWVIDKQLEFATENMHIQEVADMLSHTVLQNCPQCYPLCVRKKFFANMIQQYKLSINYDDYLSGNMLQIRRNHILEDAVNALYGGELDVRSNFRIQFIDSQGNVETGIDGGGLLKEFITSLTEIIFDNEQHYFEESEKGHLYPSIMSQYLNPEGYRQLFEVFGMVIGKALYEGIQLNCNFARFFLNKLVEKQNQVDDIQDLDNNLYENLLKIKYAGNVDDLGLFMVVNENFFGQVTEVPLVQNGAELPVNNENKILYVVQYSNYILNLKTQTQISAFVRGLKKVLPSACLQIFFPDEIQLLISGVKEISIQELKLNSVNNNWKSEELPYLQAFWVFLESLTNEQRQNFLRFATGSNRPPFLGFKSLNPKFCVAKLECAHDEIRYPSSNTCTNLFKLPFYGISQQAIEKMKKMVLEAINQKEQGFYLA